ncbi:MAG: RDD family protein [Pirellulaceae bacterium]|nr:RDD family protein [Pirellulaceae bacterium]
MLHANQEKLDCLVRVVTPENVEFEYALAGPFQRFPAYLFDLFVRVGAFVGLLFFLGMFSLFVPFAGTISTVVMILLFFVMYWFYGVYFESTFNGRTLGKMLFKLRVISTDGRPINGMQAALRNLLRLADTFPTPITGLVCMTITGRFQRIGDLAAGTMVIVDRERRPPWDLQPDDPRAYGLAELIPPSFVANYTMTQSIGMYMESRRRLPMARRLEVARHLATPLLKKFDMLPDTSPDLLLCALFVRIFMSEQQQAAGLAKMRQGQSKNAPTAPSPASPAMPGKLAIASKTTADAVTAPVPGDNEVVEIVASVVEQPASSSAQASSLFNTSSRTEEKL